MLVRSMKLTFWPTSLKCLWRIVFSKLPERRSGWAWLWCLTHSTACKCCCSHSFECAQPKALAWLFRHTNDTSFLVRFAKQSQSFPFPRIPLSIFPYQSQWFMPIINCLWRNKGENTKSAKQGKHLKNQAFPSPP